MPVEIDITISLKKMGLPLNLYFEKGKQKKKSNQRLFIHDMQIQ